MLHVATSLALAILAVMLSCSTRASLNLTKDYENMTNYAWISTTKDRLWEAVDIWRDFQQFAVNHSIMPIEEAERLCNHFESKSISNWSRIGDAQKWQLYDHDNHTQPIRILFLTTKRSLLLLSDRWYFELYMAMASQPNVEIVMWGVGMPGFRDEQTTMENMRRWFAEPIFDIVHSTWPYQRAIRGVEDQGSSKGLNHPNSRSREFKDLPGDPLITVVMQEVAMNLDELHVQPHIVFLVYEQFMGVPSSRLIDTCGDIDPDPRRANDCGINPVIEKLMTQVPNRTMIAFLPHGIDVQKYEQVEENMRNPLPPTRTYNKTAGSHHRSATSTADASSSGGNRSAIASRSSGSIADMQLLRSQSQASHHRGNYPNSNNASGPGSSGGGHNHNITGYVHTKRRLVLPGGGKDHSSQRGHHRNQSGHHHHPQHNSPYKHMKHLNITADHRFNSTLERPVNILLVGATLPSIYALRHSAQLASRKHTKLITQVRHPGYSLEYDDLCSTFAQSTMPQQVRFTRSLLESKVCLIGTAVQLVDTCRPVAWTVRKYAEVVGAGCVLVGDVPADVNLARFTQERLSGQTPQQLGQSAEIIMSRYHGGNYSRLRDEGRNFVRTHYSIAALVRKHYFGAIRAYQDGSRGIFEETRSKVVVRNDRNEACGIPINSQQQSHNDKNQHHTSSSETSTTTSAASESMTGTSIDRKKNPNKLSTADQQVKTASHSPRKQHQLENTMIRLGDVHLQKTYIPDHYLA